MAKSELVKLAQRTKSGGFEWVEYDRAKLPADVEVIIPGKNRGLKPALVQLCDAIDLSAPFGPNKTPRLWLTSAQIAALTKPDKAKE